jgi:hypothetical protein
MIRHTEGEWRFRVREIGGRLGTSYAVDLPNGASIISSSNDDNAAANMALVAAAPRLLSACRFLVAAYAKGAENHEHVDWDDIDLAHDAAALALGIAGRDLP